MKTLSQFKEQDIYQQHREFSMFVPPHLKITDLNIELNHRKRWGIGKNETIYYRRSERGTN